MSETTGQSAGLRAAIGGAVAVVSAAIFWQLGHENVLDAEEIAVWSGATLALYRGIEAGLDYFRR